MDPNKNWEEAVKVATRLQNNCTLKHTMVSMTEMLDDDERLGELIISLNDWLKNCGFPPDAWKGKDFSVIGTNPCQFPGCHGYDNVHISTCPNHRSSAK